MTIKRKILKNSLGVFFITTHMAIILWTLLEYVWFRNITPEVCESIFIAMGPLFTGYSAMIVRDFFANPIPSDESRIGISRLYIAFLLPMVTFAAVVIILAVQRRGAQFTSEEIAKILGVIEAVLGLYLGIIMRSLFEESTPSGSTAPTANASTT